MRELEQIDDAVAGDHALVRHASVDAAEFDDELEFSGGPGGKVGVTAF